MAQRPAGIDSVGADPVRRHFITHASPGETTKRAIVVSGVYA
jgi:hypothetical protein